MNVLVTGGAGYIGSHCVRALLDAGHKVTVLDNLSAGHAAAVDRRASLTVGDLCDPIFLDGVLAQNPSDSVMHFAASIEVGESVINPLKFYSNNVANTVTLLSAMQRAGIRKIVFSSTCAIYGVPERMPLTEDMPPAPESPYARAKLVVEWMLRDCAKAWGLGYVSLRYFNAAGAVGDAAIGEDHDPETHLIPNVLKVALGQSPHVKIFGTDYDTPDGTCIRDYIHVSDLAQAHLLAMHTIEPGNGKLFNAGTGTGHSVRQVIDACRSVTTHPIQVLEDARRPGDVPRLWADPGKIQRELGWKARITDLQEIVRSAWAWHKSHPKGFDDRPARKA